MIISESIHCDRCCALITSGGAAVSDLHPKRDCGKVKHLCDNCLELVFGAKSGDAELDAILARMKSEAKRLHESDAGVDWSAGFGYDDFAAEIAQAIAAKRLRMNQLFDNCVELRERQMEFWERSTAERFKEMRKAEELFDAFVTALNGTTCPMRPNLPLSAHDIAQTAAMLAGGGV